MKKWMAICTLLLVVSACGSTHGHDHDEDGEHYTQDDLAKDTDDVYRPSNSGKDDDGVDHSTVERKDDPKDEPKKEPEPKVEPKKDPKADPKKDPAATVSNPKKDPEPEVQPKKDPEPKVQPDNTAARRKLMDQFIHDVSADMDTLEGSKAWKDLLKSKEKFTDRLDKALEKGKDDKGKDAETTWAEAIKAWYEVRYMHLLFLHLNRKSGDDFEPGAGLNHEELEAYTDNQLVSADCIRTTAAYELAEPEMADVRKFQTDILKYDRVAGKIYADADHEKKWKSEKQKWQDAANGTFDSKDLKKYGS